MFEFDNPAGRLYDLLLRFRTVPKANATLTWQEVLEESDPVELTGLLAEVASLVPAIRDSVERSGSRSAQKHVDRYGRQWLRAIVPFDIAMSKTDPASVMPSEEAFEALDSVSEILRQTVPDGSIPDTAHLEAFKQQVESLITDINASEDVPVEVREPLVEHLRRVQRALNDLWLGGPDAVRSAIEQLVGAMQVAEAESPGQGGQTFKALKQQVVPIIAAVWIAFSAAPGVRADISAWEGILHGHLSDPPALTSGSEPKALPPGTNSR